ELAEPPVETERGTQAHRVDQIRSQADRFGQADGLGPGGQDRFGAGLDGPSGQIDGVDLAAQAHGAFGDDDLGFVTEPFAQPMRRGETGDAAADDQDPRPSTVRPARRDRRAHRRVVSWTRSTTSLSLPGSEWGRTPWPRLKIWLLAARPARTTSSVSARSGSSSARTAAG